MARVRVYDRVKTLGNVSSGGGALSVGTAITGFDQPADRDTTNGDFWPLLLHDESNGEWEVGFYEAATSATVFNRSSGQVVLASSNSGSAVSFTRTASDTLTVSVVDPAAFVGQYAITDSGGFPPELRSIARTISPVTYFDYQFPLLDSPRGGIHAVFADQGNGHSERCLSKNVTFDATPTTGPSIAVPAAAGSACMVKADIIVGRTGTPDEHKFISAVVCAHYDGSSVELVGSASFTTEAEDAGLSSAEVTASIVSNAIEFELTGIADTVAWLFKFDITYKNSIN